MFFTREISRNISITCDFMCEISHITFMIHGYADDLQLYQHCLPTDVDMMMDCFSMCVERIMVWMSSNRLRLNVSKTEILWLGSSRRLARTALPSSIVIDNCNVPLADEVKCLGVTQWRNYRGSSYSRAVGPGRVRGPGPTRINHEHSHSVTMN